MRLDLRLIVLTDRELAAPRPVEDIVAACLAAGAPAIQLRDKNATARALLEQATRLLRLTRRHRALLFLNDRLDVALAAGADGVHLGPADLPITAARRAAPPPFLIGYSTDDPAEARRAAAAGADYIGCGAVFGTTTKDVGGERIGLERLAQVVRAVDIPVIGIGGIGPENAAETRRTGAAGVAVIRAVMGAQDPGKAVRELLAAFAGTSGGQARVG
ncbi:MAG: thiamine phosphate synthase [Gemmatimonadetes bacterium]|nr:thiamine phosphate synthase [Gemmatimonadota bacterium]